MAGWFKYFRKYLISHRLQLTKFVLVGFTTCGIYFLSFHAFYALIHFDYRIAASLAYAISLCAHFLLHRSFTFGAAQQEVIYNMGKYILMLLFNYATLMTIMWIYVNGIKGSPYLGILFSTATSMLLNFLIMKHFVFDQN